MTSLIFEFKIIETERERENVIVRCVSTRSQAVARIADCTALTGPLEGHVTSSVT